VARDALGQRPLAEDAWRATFERFPLNWYALLAHARLGSGASRLPTLPQAASTPVVSDELLDRATELVEAGLTGWAALLLRSGESDFLRRNPGREGLRSLLDMYRRAGDCYKPWILVSQRDGAALFAWPSGETRPLWEHAYPRCARDLLTKYNHGDAELVLFLQAIMRTESGFDPSAWSVADARGLMQMIPPTARRVAERLAVDYSDERLFEPDLNIETASWYIGRLVAKFKRQWPIAAASYNAGAPAMMRWYKTNARLPLDAFVEAIPWAESRRYAQRVTQAFARYLYLEGLPLPPLGLELDPAFLEDEIDY
jgi:soluble lytic murein transglycosylase